MTTILLVDDNEDYRIMLKEVLSLAGYEVLEAQDGNEALHKYHECAADLVITDLIMPEKEGLQTIRELRAGNPAVRIVAMSGGGRGKAEDYLRLAKKLGVQQVLAKPFRHRELLEAVSAALA